MPPLDSRAVSGVSRVFRDDPVEVVCQEKEKVRDRSALSRREVLVCKELIGKVVRGKTETDRQVHGAASATFPQKLTDSIVMLIIQLKQQKQLLDSISERGTGIW